MSLTILIADDSKLSRKSLIKNLPQDLQYDIIEASNGKEAIQLLKTDPLDLLILDLTMPEVDGIAVLEFINSWGYTLPVIVISADFQPKRQEQIQALGFKHFIKKPFNEDQLALAFFELKLI